MKKEFRVKRNEDFSKIIARKKSFANSCFIIYKDENQIGHGRVGISVSKKLGNAVTRNKIKRQLRMMIQECFHFDEEVDYIVIVRKNFLNHTYIENKKELEYLYKKSEEKGDQQMILDNKTKKYFKIICLVLFVVALTGCTANLDSSGKLIAKRAINLNTPWTMKSGIFDFLLVIPISKSIIYLGDVLLNNIALGVILITILINIIILPIMIKSTVSQQKMQLIQPEMERIQNKYKGRKDQTSQMRMSAEIQALYKKNDISMLASFTTFLTLPIMFAMWQAVQRIEILYQTNMFGINLGAKPIDHVFKFEIAYIVLLAIVALTQYFAMKINTIMSRRNPKYRETSQMQSMNMMNNFMTLFIIYFAAIMPAAMSLYWMTTNIITIVRTWYIYIYHVEKAQKEVDQANTNYLTKRQNKNK